MEEERAYKYWLHNLPGAGDKTIETLLKRFDSAKQVYDAGSSALGQMIRGKKTEEIKTFFKTWDVEKEYQKLKDKKIRFISCDDVQYPLRLQKLEHPPYALYCLGTLPGEQEPAVAVIGARECSEYGSYMAQAFAGKLAAAGVTVISGMARGIDGIGQKAALEAGGRTYAVLASGVDVCYPASNKELYQEILKNGGGILSPFPPGAPPVRQQFPERNRIVAGLADMVLVIEARLKSGTWITVDMALEQGKSVYAVPGRLTDRLSDGCNFLIRQGAGIALTPEDILAELAVLRNREGRKTGKAAAEIRTKDSRGTEGSRSTEDDRGTKGSRSTEDDRGTEDSRSTEDKDDGTGKAEQADNTDNTIDTGILAYLDEYPRSADEILKAMHRNGELIELPQLLEKLIILCMEKKVRQVSGNYFSKISACDIMYAKAMRKCEAYPSDTAEIRSSNMNTFYYQVVSIDGDYANLKRTDIESDEIKLVARALLPLEITVGTQLKYQWMQYEIING